MLKSPLSWSVFALVGLLTLRFLTQTAHFMSYAINVYLHLRVIKSCLIFMNISKHVYYCADLKNNTFSLVVLFHRQLSSSCCVNLFKFLMFFNLVIYSVGEKWFSRKKWITVSHFLSMWLAVRYWCHSQTPKLRIKPGLTEKVDDQYHGNNKAWLDYLFVSRIAPWDEPSHFRGGPFFTTNKILIEVHN